MPTKGYCKQCNKLIYHIKNRSGYCIKCSPYIGKYKRNKIHRNTMSIKLSGKNNPMFGKPAWNRGIPRDEQTCQKISNSHKGLHEGNKNYFWNGGKRRIKNIYKYIFSPNHPFCTKNKKVAKHRLVMEQHLGRYLRPEEVVHHINGNTLDNTKENLILFSNNSEHIRDHGLRRYSME